MWVCPLWDQLELQETMPCHLPKKSKSIPLNRENGIPSIADIICRSFWGTLFFFLNICSPNLFVLCTFLCVSGGWTPGQESVFCFQHVSPSDWTWVVRLGSKSPGPLNHLTNSIPKLLLERNKTTKNPYLFRKIFSIPWLSLHLSLLHPNNVLHLWTKCPKLKC